MDYTLNSHKEKKMFSIREFIEAKKSGLSHNKGDITTFIEKYMTKEVTEAQMAAWLMAASIEGISFKELVELTEAMVASGDRIEWDEELYLVDKHSTGGVGDKTTLIVAPIVASLGIPMVKLSGSGLGHTGGTVDKLRSIENINIEKSKAEILEQIKQTNLYLGAQTENLVPADKRIYALRNETGTIDNIGLIAASIMSKKLATGAKAFVFDVKVGNGAFMKSIEEARALASVLRDLGKAFDKKVAIILSDMNEPLGKTIGNQLEVIEAIEVLKNDENSDKNLKDLSLALAALCILSSNHPCNSYEEAFKLANKQIENGEAFKTFEQTISLQGGNLSDIDYAEAEFTCDFFSMHNGQILEMEALTYGIASQYLGSGAIDSDKNVISTAGILLNKKVGDDVFVGENIARLYYDIPRAEYLNPMLVKLDEATKVSESKVSKSSIILEVIQ